MIQSIRHIVRIVGICVGWSIVLLVLLTTADRVKTAFGQPVQKYVSAEAPARNVRIDTTPLKKDGRARIALYRGSQTTDYVAASPNLVSDAVYYWELLLLGLQVPYTIFDDQDIARRIDDDYHVLIMPAAEALSSRQRDKIEDFVDDGGALIASGRFGLFNEQGGRVGADTFETLFSAEYVENIPAQPYGFFQSIDGHTPFGTGVSMGFQLNVAAQRPLSLARPVGSEAVGRFVPYRFGDRDTFKGLTSVVYGEYGDGHTLWMRFNPQDLSREEDQQSAYQRMIMNALAEFSDARTVAVSQWPSGRQMAVSVAVLPSVGFDPLTFMQNVEHLLTVLESQRMPASFFLSAAELNSFQDLRNRLIQAGEVGTTPLSDQVLVDQPMEVQRARIVEAQGAMELPNVDGFYPPGSFFDGNTLRALDDMGADYILLTGRTSFAPEPINWWDHVDYRERVDAQPFVEEQEPDLPVFVPGETTSSRPRQPTQDPVRIIPNPLMSIPIAADVAPTFEESYEAVRRARGFYVMPYYAERFTKRSPQVADFEKTITRARREGAWVATVFDVLHWWSVRDHIRPEIVSSRDEELHLDVHNDGNDPLEGIVLEIRLRDESPRRVHVTGDRAGAEYIEETGIVKVSLPRLEASSVERFVVSWD